LNEYILVLTTVPEEKAAQNLARALIQDRLAACVTVSADSVSFYRWEGSVHEDSERVLFIKTRTDLFTDLERRIKALHPYKVPEIIALPIVRGASEYLDWVASETRSR